MKYKLIPTSILRKLWKVNSAVNSVLKSVDEATVKRCVKMFDDLNKVEQKINDLAADVEKMEDYLDRYTLNEVKNLQQSYGIYQSEVQKNLSEHLIKVRSGNESVDRLNEVIQQALKHPFSYETINLSRFDSTLEEISFIELLRKMNVTVLNRKIIFKNFLLENFNNQIYLLFYNFTRNEDVITGEFWNLLENRQKFGATAMFAAISNQILNENSYPSHSIEKVSLYLKGKVEIENFEISYIPENATNPELWSFYFMQNQVSRLIRNPVPIGFIYVQLPNEKSPTEIWSSISWNDISNTYAGVFFRVDGGEAATFGQIQGDNAPRLVRVNRHERTIPDEKFDVDVPKGGCSKWSYTGNWVNDYNNGEWRSYCSSDGEVRPRNMAIRVWKRVA